MAEWKQKLFACTGIKEGVQLISDLRLTIPKIMAFAEYLGVNLSGCKYIKAEIVRWLIEGSLGAWLRAEATANAVRNKEAHHEGLFYDFADNGNFVMRGDEQTAEGMLETAGYIP